MAKRQAKQVGSMEQAARAMEIAEQQLFGTKEETNMAKVLKFVHNQTKEVATVTEDARGAVSVTKAAGTIPMGAAYNLESVRNSFLQNDWTEVKVSAATEDGLRVITTGYDSMLASVVTQDATQISGNVAPKAEIVEDEEELSSIPPKTQKELDDYLELHAEKAKIESKLKKLKESVVTYMKNNNLEEMKGTKGKRVEFQPATASNSTSLFTDYEVNDVILALGEHKDILKQATEVRVNGKKLEGALTASKLDKEIIDAVEATKIKKAGTPKFVVKNN
ncbi:hypothetical protein [Bacillus phage BC-T25]|nr:hypothetical protein [Bacillus phage BC-T25]